MYIFIILQIAGSEVDHTFTNLTMHEGSHYVITVVACNHAGLCTEAKSAEFLVSYYQTVVIGHRMMKHVMSTGLAISDCAPALLYALEQNMSNFNIKIYWSLIIQVRVWQPEITIKKVHLCIGFEQADSAAFITK